MIFHLLRENSNGIPYQIPQPFLEKPFSPRVDGDNPRMNSFPGIVFVVDQIELGVDQLYDSPLVLDLAVK